MRCLAALLLAALTLAAGPRSGFETMSPALQAMQQDDFANPGMLFVAEGEALFQREGCAACHAPAALRGVAARYPVFDPATGGPIDLAGRIAGHWRGGAGGRNSPPLLALTAYVANLSRGLPLAPDPDPRLDPARAAGEALFRERRGQLNLSCAQCHEEHAGRRLAGSLIPEAHANAYPIYRLEWQGMGSLYRRLRNCLVGVRAAPWSAGAPEYLALETFLAARAKGLVVETPGVRP